jgi:nucleotide-binding universal stress UspA family protein
MHFGKKIVVAVDLSHFGHTELKSLKQLHFLETAEIHFVYVFQTTNMRFPASTLSYPLEEDRRLIEESTIATLAKLGSDYLPGERAAKLICKCLFAENAKEEFSEYVEEIHADTVVVMSRERRGFFESSFAQYLAKHSRSNVLILKT